METLKGIKSGYSVRTMKGTYQDRVLHGYTLVTNLAHSMELLCAKHTRHVHVMEGPRDAGKKMDWDFEVGGPIYCTSKTIIGALIVILRTKKMPNRKHLITFF